MEASPALDIKSTSLYAIRVVLHTSDLAAILDALEQRMREAAGFFEDEPVVVDASRLSAPLDWPRLVDALKAHGLPTIGIMTPPELADSARAAGLTQLSLPAAPARTAAGEAPPAAQSRTAGGAPAQAGAEAASEAASHAAPGAAPQAAAAAPIAASVPASGAASEAAASATPPVAPAARAAAAAMETVAEQTPAAPRSVPTLVVERPLRSGQRVYARHADLIVLGVVSHGAEVIADGNIHVYGPLRGKAMAGARGDIQARIYTTRFEAELVAVAGVYRTMTTALPPDIQDKPALIRLEGEKLLVEPLPI